MTEMTFEESLRQEEENEKLRAQQRREREARLEAEEQQRKAEQGRAANSKKKKAAQYALKDRIMSDAQKRWEDGCKKQYELGQPANGPVAWLVFDRVTGELYGESTQWRAYQAWAEVNPTKLVADPEKPELEFLIAVGFNACRCVLRSEWEAAEAAFRKKRGNGHVVP